MPKAGTSFVQLFAQASSVPVKTTLRATRTSVKAHGHGTLQPTHVKFWPLQVGHLWTLLLIRASGPSLPMLVLLPHADLRLEDPIGITHTLEI